MTESLKMDSSEKRRMLAEIYTMAIKTEEDFENGRSILFMNFLSTTFPEQIVILKFIEQNEPILNQIGHYKKFLDLYKSDNENWSKSEYDFKYYCSALESQSLISMGAGLNDFRDKSSVLATSNHDDPSVTLTELGLQFLKFIVLFYFYTQTEASQTLLLPSADKNIKFIKSINHQSVHP